MKLRHMILPVALLAPVLLVLPLAGCWDDDDDNGGGTTTVVVTNVVNGTTVVPTNAAPAGEIAGAWETNMTQPDYDPSWSWDVTVTITQTGQNVQDSFQAGTPQTFTGTYAGGVMTATDSLGCFWQITFSGNTGNGTRTRWDLPVTVVRMTR